MGEISTAYHCKKYQKRLGNLPSTLRESSLYCKGGFFPSPAGTIPFVLVKIFNGILHCENQEKLVYSRLCLRLPFQLKFEV